MCVESFAPESYWSKCLFPYSNVLDKDGLKTEAITAKLELKEQMPEWLPMYSCKVRVYYHGIWPQCNKCWEPGHMSKTCEGEEINWKGFAKKLFQTGRFKAEMFGYWLDEPQAPQKTHEEELAELKSLLNKSTDLRKLVNYLKSSKEGEEGTSKPKPKPKGRPKKVVQKGKKKE